MPSHLDALQRTSSVNLRRAPGDLHSVAKRASFRVALRSDFKGFWSDFGRFGDAKMEAKIDFSDVFFHAFFEYVCWIDFKWFSGGSKPEKSLKTIVFSMVFADFHNIDGFKKLANKAWFWLRFWTPTLRKIGKKWYWRHVVFFTSILQRFFYDFFAIFHHFKQFSQLNYS